MPVLVCRIVCKQELFCKVERSSLFIIIFISVFSCLFLFPLAAPSGFRTDQYSVLTGSRDCSMKIWSLTNGECVQPVGVGKG